MIVSNNSILSLYEQTRIDTVVAWKMKALPQVPFAEDDRYYQYTINDRLDKVSYRFYGSVYYNWFIAKTNNIKLEMDIETGTVLRIPSFVSLLKYVTSVKKK